MLLIHKRNHIEIQSHCKATNLWTICKNLHTKHILLHLGIYCIGKYYLFVYTRMYTWPTYFVYLGKGSHTWRLLNQVSVELVYSSTFLMNDHAFSILWLSCLHDLISALHYGILKQLEACSWLTMMLKTSSLLLCGSIILWKASSMSHHMVDLKLVQELQNLGQSWVYYKDTGRVLHFLWHYSPRREKLAMKRHKSQ